MSVSRSLFLCGSSGALGRAVAQIFTEKKWRVIGCDKIKNDSLVMSISLNPNDDLQKQTESVCNILQTELKERKLDAVFCVGGGFVMGNANDKNFIKSSNDMINACIYPSLLSAHVASLFLQTSGVLLLTGAAAALRATPSIIGYGSAKVYVHHLTKSLACKDSGMPKDSKVVSILPVTLDTPANRIAMPHADFSTWTSLNFLSAELFTWANDPSNLINGAAYKITTQGSNTQYEPLTDY